MESLFSTIGDKCRPKTEPIRMYTFKKTIDAKADEMETVTAHSLGAAIQKAPEMMTWYLHSVSK